MCVKDERKMCNKNFIFRENNYKNKLSKYITNISINMGNIQKISILDKICKKWCYKSFNSHNN